MFLVVIMTLLVTALAAISRGHFRPIRAISNLTPNLEQKTGFCVMNFVGKHMHASLPNGIQFWSTASAWCTSVPYIRADRRTDHVSVSGKIISLKNSKIYSSNTDNLKRYSRAYSAFKSTLNYNVLFNYPTLGQSYGKLDLIRPYARSPIEIFSISLEGPLFRFHHKIYEWQTNSPDPMNTLEVWTLDY